MPASTPKTDSDSETPLEEKGPFVIVSPNDEMYYTQAFAKKDEADRYFRRYHGRGVGAAGFRIRPMNWKEREQIRFNEGDYAPPVWENEGFWQERSEELRSHYAHRSTEDPNMIAFTESADKGERDIQTRMKAGRYLKRFFPDLTAKKIAFLAEWAQRGVRPPVDFGVLDLKFAKTPEEITEVYEHGPNSCMQGSKGVSVYGAGDLAIAYLEPRHSDPDSGLPMYPARALVWPEKKAMGRIYPTPDNWSGDGFASEADSRSMNELLFDRLKAEGYESFYENRTIFDGARLLAIPDPNDDEDGSQWVMPYIDGNRFDGDGEDGFFRLKHNGNWCAGDTDGTQEGPWRSARVDCHYCRRLAPESQAVAVVTHLGPGGEVLGEAYYCQSCANRQSFVCAGYGLRVATSVRNRERDDLGRVTEVWHINNPPPPLAKIIEPRPPWPRARDYRGRFAPEAATFETRDGRVRVNIFDELSELLSQASAAHDIEF